MPLKILRMQNPFLELGLNNFLVEAVTELGYEKPTPVQSKIIPILLSEERDIVCLAQTGTGKTAAFALPIIQQLNSQNTIQALVLSPTRELCRQISTDFHSYSKHSENVKVVSVYGGASIEQQIKAIKKGTSILVATPGRLIDLIERRVVDLSHIKTLVLDEADEMLNMGFKEEVDVILEQCPSYKQTLLFSATLPLEVEGIAKQYLKNAEIITVGTRNSGAENVKHYYFVIHEKDRYSALKRLADFNPDIYGIVFCRTRQETQTVADALIRDGYNADSLHGELSQAQRDLVMSRFKQKSLKILVATDVAARGIDVSDLTHVINYNLPDESEIYTHRSGRTGRADKRGTSLILLNSKEQHKIKRIEKIIGKTISQAKIPTASEVCSKQLLHLIEEIDNVEVRDDIAPYIQVIEEKWKDLPKEELIKRVLSLEFNRFLDYYRQAPDLNITDHQKSIAKVEKGFSRIKINLGFKHNITPRHLIRMASACGVGKNGVGKIEINKDHSFLEVSSKAVKYFADEINESEYRGHHLKAEIL